MRLTSVLSVGSAITPIAACEAAPVSPVDAGATGQPDCAGSTFIDDGRPRTAAQPRETTSTWVKFGSGNTLVKLEDPFCDGMITADTAVFAVQKLMSAAAVTVVGTALPLASPRQANLFARASVHPTLPISFLCAPAIAAQAFALL
jgi:hypothetical protein